MQKTTNDLRRRHCIVSTTVIDIKRCCYNFETTIILNTVTSNMLPGMCKHIIVGLFNSVSSRSTLVNRFLHENRRSTPIVFNGKTFKKCNPPNVKLDHDKLNNKNFPHMVLC